MTRKGLICHKTKQPNQPKVEGKEEINVYICVYIYIYIYIYI